MKLTILRTELLRMLTFAMQAVPSKSAESQYLNVLFDVKEDSFDIITSDGALAAKIHQEKVGKDSQDVILAIEPGKIQTPAKLLLDIISKLGGDIVTLEVIDSTVLNISDDTSDFNLVTKPGEEYPDVDLEAPESSKGFKIPVSDLKELFDTTSFAVTTKGNATYSSIQVKASQGKLSFFATDTFRFAYLAKPELTEDAEFSFNCPVKPLEMVTRSGDSVECEIFLEDRRAYFKIGDSLISTGLVEGVFPDGLSLIPPHFPYQVKISTEEFLKRAERVRIISSMENRDGQVLMRMTSDSLVLYAKSVNFGNSQETFKNAEIDMSGDLEVFEIAFNIDYLIDAVKALHSEEVSLCFQSPIRLFQVKSENEENVQVITPIRRSSY